MESRFLLDTNVLSWLVKEEKVPHAFLDSVLGRVGSRIFFSAASVWEVAIKSGLGKPHFQVEALAFRTALLAKGLEEVAITGENALGVAALPNIHKDPFDRMLLAQAFHLRCTLLTTDAKLAQYGNPAVLVRHLDVGATV